MARQKVKFELAEQEFEIGPMTLGQLEDVLPLLQQANGADIKSFSTSLNKILVILLSVKYPDVTEEFLRNATLQEVKDAVDQIGSISGLAKQGEAVAEKSIS